MKTILILHKQLNMEECDFTEYCSNNILHKDMGFYCASLVCRALCFSFINKIFFLTIYILFLLPNIHIHKHYSQTKDLHSSFKYTYYIHNSSFSPRCKNLNKNKSCVFPKNTSTYVPGEILF